MQFKIKGFRKPQGIVEALFEAPSATDATRLAEVQGLRIISVTPLRRLPSFTRREQGTFPLVLFSQELNTLLRAGLSLIDALESLAEKEDSPASRRVLEDVTRYLYEGKSLSQALSNFPSVFPDLYVALIQASERTGELADALGRYVAYRNQVDLVRKKIVSASIYPVLLLAVGTLVMLFLLGYVVPSFSQVFDDMGDRLPWLSQMLLVWGRFLQAHQGLMLGIAAGVIAAIALLARDAAFRARIGRLVESVPAIRQRMFLYQLARFYRSLGMLLRGGIPIMSSIGMVRGLLGLSMRDKLDAVARKIREGHPFSDSMEAHRLTTPVALRMLRAGEKSGNLGEMMERTADFYDEEMTRWVDWFIKLFEPVLMTLIGVMIGLVVILMYIPIFELARSIQ